MNLTIAHTILFVRINFNYSPCKVYEAGRLSANKYSYSVTNTWRCLRRQWLCEVGQTLFVVRTTFEQLGVHTVVVLYLNYVRR